MRRKMKFLQDLQKDIMTFIYLNIVFMLYRIVFLYVFSYQLVNVTEHELLMTCWYGLRISLKTAGMFTLIGALLSTIPHIFFETWPGNLLRKLWHGFCIFLITLAFFARIPYYKIFNSGYTLMLFNGVADDWHTIYITAVKQYQLYPRLLGVVIVTFILSYILFKILGMSPWEPKIHKKVITTLVVIILIPFMYLVRFGGGYNFGTSIYWENAAKNEVKFT